MQFFQNLTKKSLKLIFAILSVLQSKVNKLPLMWLFMECQEHTLLSVHKIMFTCGNIKVKHQGLRCLNQPDKSVTENLVDKFVGLLNKNLISIRFTTWTNLITQNNVKMWFVQLLSVNKCLLSEDKVELSEDLPFHISLKNLSFSGNHFLWSLVSTAIKQDWLWLTLLES